MTHLKLQKKSQKGGINHQRMFFGRIWPNI